MGTALCINKKQLASRMKLTMRVRMCEYLAAMCTFRSRGRDSFQYTRDELDSSAGGQVLLLPNAMLSK